MPGEIGYMLKFHYIRYAFCKQYLRKVDESLTKIASGHIISIRMVHQERFD
jgi:hypothetical protein